jgi:hypothetical protein
VVLRPPWSQRCQSLRREALTRLSGTKLHGKTVLGVLKELTVFAIVDNLA